MSETTPSQENPNPSAKKVAPKALTYEEEENQAPPISFFKLFRYATKRDKVLMFFGLIASAINGACTPAFALLFGDIADKFSGPDVIKEAAILFAEFFGIGVLAWVCSYISFATWMITGESQAIEIRKRYFRSLLKQEIGFFDTINPNELASKIADECFTIQGGIGEKICTFVFSFSMLISGFIIGYIKGWQLALVLTGIVPFLALSGTAYVFSVQKQTDFTATSYSKAGAISEEALNAVKTVQSLCGQEKEIKRYSIALDKHNVAVVKFALFAGLAMGSVMFILFGQYCLGFWYGQKLVGWGTTNAISDEPYTGGDVLTVFFSIMFAGFSISQATPAFKKFAAAKSAGARAFRIIDRESKISIEDERGLKPSTIQGNIEFTDIKFAYPTKPDRIILNGISIKANRNEKLAFVGESGCGKTTCMQLIERFYDLEAGCGSIKLDGVELKDLNLRWLREHIGYVGQEPVLFATSIRENMLIAKEDATDTEIWDALKKANAADFVENLPEKLDTVVGTNATNFSGGQKQRLAIARAILKNPVILLLDEATSALDRKNEREIQKTLDSISEGRTTITIAHRLTTIIHADRIVVFDGGKIVEEGKHEDLIARQGKYYALQHLQMQNQEEADKEGADANSGDSDEGSPKGNDVVSPQETDKERITLTEENALLRKSSRTEHRKKTEEHEKKPDSVALEVGGAHGASEAKGKKQKVKKEEEGVTGRLLAMNKDGTFLLVLGLIFAALNGSAYPISAIVLAKIINVFANPTAPDFEDKAVEYSLWFLAFGVGTLIFCSLQLSTLNLVGENLSKKIRIAVFKKYLYNEGSWFDLPENAPGILVSRLATDANLVNSLASTVLGVSVQATSSFVTGTVIAFIASWELTLVTLAVSPMIMIAGKIQAGFDQGFSSTTDVAYRESANYVTEAVNNMRTVASFARENKLLKNYEAKLEEPLKKAIKKGNLTGLAFGFSQFSMFFVYGVVFLVGAVFLVKIDLSYEDLFESIFGVMFAAFGAGNAMQYAPDVGKATTAAVNIFKILDREPEIRIDDPNQTINTPIKGEIEFKDVWFRYPTRPKDVLKGVSFQIHPSSKVAFVGPSGCGKSTIMSLLLRFYNPTQGQILIDGIDIKKYDLTHLRKSFGIVSQEPTLFNETIEYNIKYSKENATFEEMRQAAAEANALNFIEGKGEEDENIKGNQANQKDNGTGFQRRVGPKGSQISGGQKQRVAIARAILKKPAVLLLDEATSALDAQSEKVVQESLDKIMQGKTAAVIAHRISTIRDADEILVFNEGLIIEKGTYKDLLQQQGIFYKLEKGIDLNA